MLSITLFIIIYFVYCNLYVSSKPIMQLAVASEASSVPLTEEAIESTLMTDEMACASFLEATGIRVVDEPTNEPNLDAVFERNYQWLLDNHTIRELKQIAKEAQIKRYGDMKKTELATHIASYMMRGIN